MNVKSYFLTCAQKNLELIGRFLRGKNKCRHVLFEGGLIFSGNSMLFVIPKQSTSNLKKIALQIQ